MVDVSEVWSEALPAIKDGVTGVGVWTALNVSVAIKYEDGNFVVGVPYRDQELAGHLRLPQTKRLIEQEVGIRLNTKVNLRVIEGTEEADWETEKRRDAEKRRLQEQAVARARAEVAAGTSWDSVYEQLSRKFAATPNRSLPQNRAQFFMEAIDLVAEALSKTPVADDFAERQYARCLERISQYTELPSTLVAVKVLERTFQG